MEIVDLTKVSTSYVYQITRMNPTVQQLFYDRNTSFEEMQKAVACAVKKAQPTKARARFLGYLEECIDKRAIENLCSNAVTRGRRYQG